MDWRTFAAAWGAGLSTFLALSRLIPEWPLVTLEPGGPPGEFEPAWIRIRVMNPAKRFLIITEMSQISLKHSSNQVQFFHERDVRKPEDKVLEAIKFAQRAFGKDLLVYVPGEGNAFIRIAAITAGTNQILLFWWHRNWLLGFSLPICVRVSSHLARQINGA